MRKNLVELARLLYDRGYSVGSEGNLSIRLPDENFLITPSRSLKHFLTEDDLVCIDPAGKVVEGKRPASTERFTHLEIYSQVPTAAAIVHAHPHYVLLCSVTGLIPFEKPFLLETALFLPSVIYAGFALPSSEDGARAIQGKCGGTQALILEGHGVFTWGESLEEAFSLLEIMEKTARMFYEAYQAGLDLHYLNEQQIQALRKIKY